MVAASGTGAQEVSVRIHALGAGVSQLIGTGGRDLSEQVGGIMMIDGIRALAADPATSVIVLVSKPPAPSVEKKVLAEIAAAGKPVVVYFVGGSEETVVAAGGHFASGSQDAALQPVRLGATPDAAVEPLDTRRPDVRRIQAAQRFPLGHGAAVLEPNGGIGVTAARLPGDRPGPAAPALDVEDQAFRVAVRAYFVDRLGCGCEDGGTLRGQAVEADQCPRDERGMSATGSCVLVAGYQPVTKRSMARPGFVRTSPSQSQPRRRGGAAGGRTRSTVLRLSGGPVSPPAALLNRSAGPPATGTSAPTNCFDATLTGGRLLTLRP